MKKIENSNSEGHFARLGTKKECGALLQMPPKALDSLMRQGLPHYRITKRRTRFDLAEVADWVRKTYHTQLTANH